MMTDLIQAYLVKNRAAWARLIHPPASDLRRLARVANITADRLVRVILVEVDGQVFVCALPASESLSLLALRQALGAAAARVLRDSEVAAIFPASHRGAEPPFGGMVGLPVVIDTQLTREPRIVMRAGTYGDCIEMPYGSFAELERPVEAEICVPGWARTPSAALPVAAAARRRADHSAFSMRPRR